MIFCIHLSNKIQLPFFIICEEGNDILRQNKFLTLILRVFVMLKWEQKYSTFFSLLKFLWRNRVKTPYWKPNF